MSLSLQNTSNKSDKTNKNVFATLTISAIQNETLTVTAVRGSESLSKLFEFDINFKCKNHALKAEDIIYSVATLTFQDEGHKRIFNGIISHFSQGTTAFNQDIETTEYFFTLRPKLWLLTLDHNYRMFQNKGTTDIVGTILKENGITDRDLKNPSHNPVGTGNDSREYCIQYNESSFNFISRLLEDDGFFYYFNHEDGKHTLVITDSFDKSKTPITIEYINNVPKIRPLGKVFNLNKNTFVNVSSYAAGDYNYTISNTKLFNSEKSKWKPADNNKKTNKFYEYPAGFSSTSAGDALIKRRIQEIDSQHILLTGESTAPELNPGVLFEITKHHSKVFNGKYVVYEIEHMFSITEQGSVIYQNRFSALPEETPFRPPRITPKPKIYGNQTAIVVCASSNDEIYRNDMGCIKVHFHWDQEGANANTTESSCWIRVAQMLSGSNWGGVWIPRVGQEVVVSFLEGDPDRPLVVGCVYNDQFKPPYTDEHISTIKTTSFENPEGFNEFRFTDTNKKEEIYLHAQKDMNIDIINSRSTVIEKSDDTLEIREGSRSTTLLAKDEKKFGHDSLTLKRGDRTIKLEKGDSSITLNKGNSNIVLDEGNSSITLNKGNRNFTINKGDCNINLNNGDQKVTITGDCTIHITGDLKVDVDKDLNVSAGKNIKINAGKKISVTSGKDTSINCSKYSMTAKASASMTALSNITIKANGNMSVKTPMNCNISSLADCNITGLRCNFNAVGVATLTSPCITIGGGMIQLG